MRARRGTTPRDGRGRNSMGDGRVTTYRKTSVSRRLPHGVQHPCVASKEFPSGCTHQVRSVASSRIACRRTPGDLQTGCYRGSRSLLSGQSG